MWPWLLDPCAVGLRARLPAERSAQGLSLTSRPWRLPGGGINLQAPIPREKRHLTPYLGAFPGPQLWTRLWAAQCWGLQEVSGIYVLGEAGGAGWLGRHGQEPLQCDVSRW